VFKARNSIFPSLIEQGLLNLKSVSFTPEIQDNEDSTTFPRLFTPTDGRINFYAMRGVDFEKFVYAFGYPFEGAHCFVDNLKINLLLVEFRHDISFHSFANGLIFGKTKEGEYKVVVSDGYVIIKKVLVDGKEVAQKNVFKIGRRLS
jgi:methionyl-tRNA formyltransferase